MSTLVKKESKGANAWLVTNVVKQGFQGGFVLATAGVKELFHAILHHAFGHVERVGDGVIRALLTDHGDDLQVEFIGLLQTAFQIMIGFEGLAYGQVVAGGRGRMRLLAPLLCGLPNDQLALLGGVEGGESGHGLHELPQPKGEHAELIKIGGSGCERGGNMRAKQSVATTYNGELLPPFG